MLSCRDLGPVEVRVDEAAIDLGGPTVRRALDALLVGSGNPVADGALAEQIWGDDQPVEVTNAMRVVISRLRQTLGPQGAPHLRRTPTGYAFTLPSEQTDRGRFETLVQRGMAQAGVDDAAAAALLGEALSLWRGEPWSELDDGQYVAGARTRLSDLHESAVEEWLAARLATGDVSGVLTSLSEAITAAPYRERRWELLALGLYRSGRQVQARAELRRVRQLLVDDLGVEPGPALCQLEQRMLDNDPTLITTPDIPHAGESTAEHVHAAVRRHGSLSSFVGRDSELAEVRRSLESNRLVTITGPAGVGKTRLAVEYSHRAKAKTTAWCAMADIHTLESIAPTMALAAGATHLARDPLEAFSNAMMGSDNVLIVDNCEHLTEPIADVVATLLAKCPGLTVLATSRQPLGVDGECLVIVDPLPVVSGDGSDGAAVQLLSDRIRAYRGDAGGSERSSALRAVCEAADGLPLAIELAAARSRAIDLEDIASRLRDRLDILGTTPQGSPSPHASLAAAIAWSVDLLSADDRAVLLRLWPFEGGFTWQAAQAVLTGPADAPVLVTLASLVDRSLVIAEAAVDGSRRYRLLETIRRYCAATDPDPRASRLAHAHWVRDLARQSAPLVWGVDAPQAVLVALNAERANVRAAIAHDLAVDPPAALRLAADLRWFWVGGGFIDEGLRAIAAALDAAGDLPCDDRVRAMEAMSLLHWYAGDEALALELGRQALALLDEVGDADPELLVDAHSRICNALIDTGRLDELRSATERFMEIVRSQDAPGHQWACAWFSVSVVRRLEGDYPEALAALSNAIDVASDGGSASFVGIGEVMRAWCLLEQGGGSSEDAKVALEAVSRALTAFGRQRNQTECMPALYAGSGALAACGAVELARGLHDSVLRYARQIGTNPRRYAPRDVDLRMSALLADTVAHPSADTDIDGLVATYRAAVAEVAERRRSSAHTAPAH